MTSHTPGPWRITRTSTGWDIRGPEPQNWKVAATGVVEDAYHESSNARLIAAAPELLEACKIALPLCEELGEKSQVRALRAAIARAEGEVTP